MRRIAAFVFAVLLAVPALSSAGSQEAWPSRPIIEKAGIQAE